MRRRRVAVATVALLAWAAAAHAQDALYATAAAVSLPFVWARLRETRGKALEQM